MRSLLYSICDLRVCTADCHLDGCIGTFSFFLAHILQECAENESSVFFEMLVPLLKEVCAGKK